MKNVVAIISFISFAIFAMAQTPQQIVSQMDAELQKHTNEGVVMNVDMKIPIVGTMTTKTYTLGDNSRMEMEVMGEKVITWTDKKYTWIYTPSSNSVRIDNLSKKSSSEGNIKLFSGITEGYEVTISKETNTEWHIACKKLKTNPDKSASKTMDLVVAKGTYWPVSLTTSVKGVTVTMRDIAFGVTEEQVTFNQKDYPNISVVDKR